MIVTTIDSVFAAYHNKAYKFRFDLGLHVKRIAGGVPKDPNVAAGWLKTKIGLTTEEQIQEATAKVMLEAGVSADAAVEEVNKNRHLNGFKIEDGVLYIEGRQLKAAIREAASVALNAGRLSAKWGTTKKGLLSWLPEHIFVVEDVLLLRSAFGDVKEPTGIMQRFVHTWRGTGIQYEEYVDDVTIQATVISDWELSPDDWAAIWTTGEQQGIGASRSQGFGRYKVTKWDQLKVK